MAQTFQMDLKELLTQDALLVDFRENVLVMSCNDDITDVSVSLFTREEYSALKGEDE